MISKKSSSVAKQYLFIFSILSLSAFLNSIG